MQNTTFQKLGAEFLGTFWLTFGGCASAVIAGSAYGVGGVSLAFGLAVMTAAVALGPISGGHFNPAISIGLAVAGRFRAAALPGYVLAQVLGATAAIAFLTFIAGKGITGAGAVAANGFGQHSPGQYGMAVALACEFAMTLVFVLVVLGATARRAAAAIAPLAIGACLTLIHLVSIPVTNTSVNPARSTGAALFAPEWALMQLWAFWLAPIAGGIVAALVYRAVAGKESD